MRAVTRAELSGSQPIFLLDVSWGGRSYRFSTYPISIEKNDGSTISYDGGFSDPDVESSLDMLEASPEASAVAVEVVFPVDLVQELMQYGRSLETATAEISMVMERNGSIVEKWEDRIRMASGDVTDPIVGDPERAVGYAAFSIERNPNRSAAFILGADAVIERGDFAFLPAGVFPQQLNSIGKNWPVILGSPGYQISQPTAIGTVGKFNYAATPAYFIKLLLGVDPHRTDSTITLLICAGEPVASTVGIQDYLGNTITGRSVQTATVRGLPYSFVTFDYAADGLFHPWLRVQVGLSTNFALVGAETDDPMWWISWENGGGLPNPYGSGALEGGGDLLRYAINQSGVDVDQQSFSNVSQLLNTYKFAGYVSDPEITWWDWVLENVLDYLPIQVTDGPDGLRAVVPLMLMAGYIPSRVAADVGPGFQIVSALEPVNEQADIINYLKLSYAYIPSLEAFQSFLVLSGDPESNSWRNYLSEQAVISRNRYGTRAGDIELDYVEDFQTATQIADYLIRRDSLIRREIVVEADPEWGFLAPGDVVSVTAPEWYLSAHRMQLTGKSWIGSGWELRLELEENPMVNIRS